MLGVFRNTLAQHAGKMPLLIPLKGQNDLVLGSHGPAVAAQELLAGIRRTPKGGGFTHKDAIDWINSNAESLGLPRVKSIPDFLSLMRSSTFENRKDMVGRLLSNHPYGHSSGATIPLPRRDDVLSKMIIHGRSTIPTGSPLAAVYIDPKRGLEPSEPNEPHHHPNYAGLFPGINLGHTKQMALEDLLPSRVKELAQREAFQGRPVGIGSLLNSAYKSHRHFVSPQTLRRLAHG